MPLQEALLLGFGEKALHETVSAVSALPTWSLASQLPERQMNGSDGLAACEPSRCATRQSIAETNVAPLREGRASVGSGRYRSIR